MSNATLPNGASKLLKGPLGVVGVAFKGYYLGKTTAAGELTKDADEMDIMFQQDGTKASDQVTTGVNYGFSTTFGEIKTSLLKLLIAGFKSTNEDPDSDSGVFGRNVYQSKRETEAGALKILAITADGVLATDDMDIACFYEAIPSVDGALLNWGADTQRGITINWLIPYHQFEEGEATEVNGETQPGAFGYYGDPEDYGIPAVDWPDVGAPNLVTAEATDDNEITLTFDKDIEFVTAFAAGDYIANINSLLFKPPTGGAILAKVLTLTFAAASFAIGDKIYLSITKDAVQSTATVGVPYPGVINKFVKNSVPEDT